MSNLLNLPTPFNMVVLIVALVMATQVISAVAKQIRLGVGHHLDLQFKREMIERGLSVEEIERLVAADSRAVREEAHTCGLNPRPRYGG